MEFEQIREGVLLLKNKGLRAVIMASSLNFALKSEEEQQAILYQFQNFLNSLDFPVQILVQSRRLNITGYLDKLKTLEEKEENDLLKVQIANYRKFIAEIMAGGVIMQKSFYVVVPFSPIEGAEGTKLRQVAALARKAELTEEGFQRAKTQLWQRVEFVVLGLRRCALQTAPLNSRELIELLWGFYHQPEAEKGYYPEIPPELIT
ncbi:MAG: hypothetical protein G01um101430_84 [Parcubacteria group bacterium Gr01-1014_30]|nr:MAG: hypothetical protein G01um101430_84 [Parcubacteria group bacterium Gr01-1014_30]